MENDDKRLITLEINMAKVKTHVEHIEGELSTNVCPTISKIWDKVNEMCIAVKDNTFWVGKFKWAVVWISTVFVGGGLVTTIFYIIRNGILKAAQ